MRRNPGKHSIVLAIMNTSTGATKNSPGNPSQTRVANIRKNYRRFIHNTFFHFPRPHCCVVNRAHFTNTPTGFSYSTFAVCAEQCPLVARLAMYDAPRLTWRSIVGLRVIFSSVFSACFVISLKFMGCRALFDPLHHVLIFYSRTRSGGVRGAGGFQVPGSRKRYEVVYNLSLARAIGVSFALHPLQHTGSALLYQHETRCTPSVICPTPPAPPAP